MLLQRDLLKIGRADAFSFRGLLPIGRQPGKDPEERIEESGQGHYGRGPEAGEIREAARHFRYDARGLY